MEPVNPNDLGLNIQESSFLSCISDQSFYPNIACFYLKLTL